jgi:hypothetical protein
MSSDTPHPSLMKDANGLTLGHKHWGRFGWEYVTGWDSSGVPHYGMKCEVPVPRHLRDQGVDVWGNKIDG